MSKDSKYLNVRVDMAVLNSLVSELNSEIEKTDSAANVFKSVSFYEATEESKNNFMIAVAKMRGLVAGLVQELGIIDSSLSKTFIAGPATGKTDMETLMNIVNGDKSKPTLN